MSIETGIERERTEMYGEDTVFVSGIHDVNVILGRWVRLCRELNDKNLQDSKHIHITSFAPTEEEAPEWDILILTLLNRDLWVTLDYDIEFHEYVLDFCWNERNRFISLINIPLQNLPQLNYNAVIRLNDKSNGSWCHRVHDLKSIVTYRPG